MSAFAGLSAILIWFVFLTRRALWYGFNPDDVMLLNYAIARPLKLNLESVPFFWNGYIRPLGSVFYLVLYKVFGYWAPPYRAAAFLLLAANLVLSLRFFRSLLPGMDLPLVAVLVACFHGQMWDMYANTGTVYDLLCQVFVLLAVTIWIRNRAHTTWRTWAAVTLLTIGAVDSKEMGVAIPPVLLAYDLLFRRPVRVLGIITPGLVAAIFLLGRFAQPTAVTGNPAFTPIVSVNHYLYTTRLYLGFLLDRPGLSQSAALAILFGALAAALALRNRLMLFGIAYYLFTLLPLSFASGRSGYALYVPSSGAILYLVALLAETIAWLSHRIRFRRLRPALTAAFALLVATTQFRANQRLQASNSQPGYLPQLEALTNGMRRAYPRLAPGSTVTLVNDPFLEDNQYTPLFTLRAFYNDPALQVRRLHWNPAAGTGQLAGAHNVLLFAGLHSWRFGERDSSGYLIDGRPPQTVNMGSPLAALTIAADVAPEAAPDGTRWAYANPSFLFSRPAAPRSRAYLDYFVPGVILDQTGPLRLLFDVNGTAQTVSIARPGLQHFSAPVSGNDPLVHLKVHAQNPFVGKDGSKLSFLVKSAGAVAE